MAGLLKSLFGKKEEKSNIMFDPETQLAVIRCSICTGEQAAGFKNRSDGHFTEVMLIRTEEDLKEFEKIIGSTEIIKEY